MFIDGASRGNPGPASAGVVFQDGEGKVTKSLSKNIGIATNNTAEYCALIFAMQEALMMGIAELEVFTDSELLTRQFSGEYRVKDENLKVLSALIGHLKQGFRKLSVSHVPREKNKLADQAANQALDAGPFFL